MGMATPTCFSPASGARFAHVSTDYVFPGDASTPYVEEDATGPLGVYGQTKLDGERAVLAALPSATIVRTAWVFGAEGNNFVKTMLRLMKEREQLSVVADQRGRPTAAGDLADALLTLGGAGGGEVQSGIFHFCNTGETTWHGFATAIFTLAADRGLPTIGRVEPIPASDYPTPAARPANSALDCRHIADVYGITAPPWQTSLARCLDEMT